MDDGGREKKEEKSVKVKMTTKVYEGGRFENERGDGVQSGHSGEAK